MPQYTNQAVSGNKIILISYHIAMAAHSEDIAQNQLEIVANENAGSLENDKCDLLKFNQALHVYISNDC